MKRERVLYRLEEVSLELGGRRVLHVPSLELEGGRVHALVGPNGAGKSVLLNLLAGLAVPSGGSVSYGGRMTGDSGWRRKMRREVTLVHQSPYLFRGTVASNVSFGMKIRGVPRGERAGKAEKALAMVGLGGFGERRAEELSGGEIQRVAVARALAVNPKVILFDEPTANIDASSVRLLEEVILGLAAENRTIIFSTHDLAQAGRLAEKRLFISEGRITTAPVRNFFRGRIVERGGTPRFDTGRAVFSLGKSAGEGVSCVGVEEEGIVLSRDPAGECANRFEGKVAALTVENGGVRVEVDAGERFTLLVSRGVVEREGLALGEKVYLDIAPDACRLL